MKIDLIRYVILISLRMNLPILVLVCLYLACFVVSYNVTLCESLYQQKTWVEEALLSPALDEDVYEELNTLRKMVSQQIAQMCVSKVF
jgi:hypothetical protein